MDKPSIERIEKTLEDAVSAFLEGRSDYHVDINALDLRIRIKGKSWQGVVDPPLAKFVLDLDKRVSDELAKIGVRVPASDRGFIAVQVKDGSIGLPPVNETVVKCSSGSENKRTEQHEEKPV